MNEEVLHALSKKWCRPGPARDGGIWDHSRVMLKRTCWEIALGVGWRRWGFKEFQISIGNQEDGCDLPKWETMVRHQFGIEDQWTDFEPVTFEGLRLPNGMTKEALGYACLHSCSQPHTSLYPLHRSLKSFHWPPGIPILWSMNPQHHQPPLPHPSSSSLGLPHSSKWRVHTEFLTPTPLTPAFSTSTSDLPAAEVQTLKLSLTPLFVNTPHPTLQEIQWLSIWLRIQTRDLTTSHKVLPDLDLVIVSLALLSFTHLVATTLAALLLPETLNTSPQGLCTGSSSVCNTLAPFPTYPRGPLISFSSFKYPLIGEACLDLI